MESNIWIGFIVVVITIVVPIQASQGHCRTSRAHGETGGDVRGFMTSQAQACGLAGSFRRNCHILAKWIIFKKSPIFFRESPRLPV